MGCADGSAGAGIALFEPKSTFEENWDKSTVKNALRAEASKSSHCIVECLGFDGQMGKKSGNIGYENEKSPTLNAGKVMSVILNDQGGSSINVEVGNVMPTLRAQSHQHEPVIALQGNGIDRADTAGCNGCGYRENEMYTLNTVDRPAVCYDARGNGDGETVSTITGDHESRITDYTALALYTRQRSDEFAECGLASCESARQYKDATDLVVQKSKPPRKYILRRLMPVECARLQGFPDRWGELAPYNPADAEFWESVRKTYAEINGKKYKPVKNLKKWYSKLHNDGAEYKMWGNGIALPCAEYVLHGIAECGAKTLGSLFDGSGGFPLAGAMNGIMPLWSSEVEPYPIAVTKSRFK